MKVEEIVEYTGWKFVEKRSIFIGDFSWPLYFIYLFFVLEMYEYIYAA